MKNLYSGIQRFVNNEEGVTAIEYALIASLIAVVIILAVTATGTAVNQVFIDICSALSGTNCGG